MKEQANKKSRVAIVRCDSYERNKVEEAVKTAIRLVGGIDSIGIPKDREIILKPNLLGKAEPEKAVTTHPEVFRAVGKILQEAGYSNIKYGDSPGNPLISLRKVAEGCGIASAADELNIPLGDFEHGREVDFEDGRTANQFILCEEVAKVCLGAEEERGGIINICKMKTHQLERITGAMKNIFGCVYGINKSASHAKYPNAEVFGRMTADLNRMVKPKLHIMDGIVAMQGNGPMSGEPVKMNVILASTDPVALDTAFCNLVALNQDLVPTIAAGVDAGLGTCDEGRIEAVIAGIPMEEDGAVKSLDEVFELLGNRNFQVQRSPEYRGQFKKISWLFKFLEKKPVVRPELCVGCGICVESCPIEGKAIHIINQKAAYEYRKCIKCYCCQEMCPKEAIYVKKSILAKIMDREWKM